jgi:hypothetical protein
METNAMKTLLLTLQILPSLLSAVKAVEAAIPLPGQGQKKLDLVLGILKTAYDAGTALAAGFSWDKLAAIVVPMINQIVALHNALGLFQKSAPSGTP